MRGDTILQMSVGDGRKRGKAISAYFVGGPCHNVKTIEGGIVWSKENDLRSTPTKKKSSCIRRDPKIHAQL